MATNQYNRCLICGCGNLSEIRRHQRLYIRCSECDHSSLLTDERGSATLAKKYLLSDIRRNNEILQNTLSENYFTRTEPIISRRLSLLQPYLTTGSKILDANAMDGRLVKSLQQNGFSARGLSVDDIFSAYWNSDISKNKVSCLSQTNKFDAILMFDYIEFAYCPYSEILDAFARLTSNGFIAVDISLDKQYLTRFKGRTQEFTSKSAEIFAQNCNSSAIVIHSLTTSFCIIHRGELP